MRKMLMAASVPSMIGMFNMDNIRMLLDMGYEVHVACNFNDTSVWSEKRTEDFRYQLKKMGCHYHQVDFARNPKNIKKVLKSCRQTNNLMKRENFCFVHCHTPVAAMCIRIVCMGARHKETRVFYTAHGFHFYKGAPIRNWLLYYPVEWLCSWWTDILITINKEDYKIAKRKLHARENVYVPGVGIDTTKFKPNAADGNEKRTELGLQSEDIMLLSVGELNTNKNHQIVIRALFELNNPHIKYFICGVGELRLYLLNLIKDLRLSSQIRLLDFRTDVLELYQAADLFILPSHREGVSVALMEAIACQVPVICSKIRGNEDLVNDYLFDEKNVEELIHTLKGVVTTRKGIHEIMEQSVHMNYENLRTFDLKYVSKKMRNLYQSTNDNYE